MATEEQRKKHWKVKIQWREKNIANKTYYCEKCDRAYYDSTFLKRHLKTTKHIDGYALYKCDLIIHGTICTFKTRDKSKYNTHLKTKKHNYGKSSQLPLKK